MKVRSEKGFTLVEVIMAMMILILGVGIISSIIADVSRKNFLSHNHTQAIIIAQNKIEELINDGYESPNLAEGFYENPGNPIDATGDSSGVFYQYWQIDDVKPIERSKQITSWVQWADKDNTVQTVRLTSVCIDQSN